jgi:hypothetical protein
MSVVAAASERIRTGAVMDAAFSGVGDWASEPYCGSYVVGAPQRS